MPTLRRRLSVVSNLNMVYEGYLAAGLDRFGALQFGGELIGFVSREAELGEAVVWHVESGLTGAAVDDHADRDRVRAMLAALFEGFNDAATTGNDVLDDQHLFAGLEFEVAAQFELVVDFFEKYEAQAQLAGDFLADHQAAHCGADDGGGTVVFQVGDEELSHAGDFVHVLANLRALEEMGTVQAGAQEEVAAEERAAIAENLENFFLFGIHVGRLRREA